MVYFLLFPTCIILYRILAEVCEGKFQSNSGVENGNHGNCVMAIYIFLVKHSPVYIGLICYTPFYFTLRPCMVNLQTKFTNYQTGAYDVVFNVHEASQLVAMTWL